MPVGVFRTLRWKDHIDRFLHAPQTEITLVGLILLSVLLVVSEVVLETHGLTIRWVSHLQVGLTGILIAALGLR